VTTQSGPMWASAALDLLQDLEDAADLTVLGAGPATLSALPEALGGDPGQQADLTARASSPTGFLEVLRAKAHYLMLPERLATDIRTAGLPVTFSDVQASAPGGSGAGAGDQDPVDDDPADSAATVQLGSGAAGYLASLGDALARQPVPPVSGPLTTVYQQLAQAWLTGVATGDADWPGRLDAATHDYADAQTADGAAADPRQACLQAATAYVAGRTTAWYDTLHTLSNAIQSQAAMPHDQLASLLDAASAQYDGVASQQVFGTVGGSPIVQPGLPEGLRQALDADVLESLPLTKPFDETPLRPLCDAILAGQVPSAGPSEDDQLIQEIAQNLVVRVGWGTDPDRDVLEKSAAAALRSTLEAQGTAGTFDPVAGARVIPASLAQTIRAVLGLADSAPVGWAQVVSVLQEVFLDQDPFSCFEALRFVAQMPAVLQPSWTASDPDETGSDLDSLAAQIESDVLFGSDQAAAPAFAAPVAAAAGQEKITSELIKAAMARNKKFFAELLKPSTQETGNEVERIIQADYILQHPGHVVLVDTFVWDIATQAWRAIGGNPQEDQAKSLLVSPDGAAYKPDICDLTSYEVFEIKPFRQVFRGLAQLYLRYLVPLNVGIFGYATANAILTSIDATGAITAPVTLSARPYLPGMHFESPRWYPLGDSWAFVMLVAPGVIGYEVVSEVDEQVQEQEQEARERLMGAMAAMIAAAAAAAGARNVSGRPFTPDDLPPMVVPASSTDATDFFPVLVAAILFVAILSTGGAELPLPALTRLNLAFLGA